MKKILIILILFFLLILSIFVITSFSDKLADVNAMIINNLEVNEGSLYFSGYIGNSAFVVVGHDVDIENDKMVVHILTSLFSKRKISEEANFFEVKEKIPCEIKEIYVGDNNNTKLIWKVDTGLTNGYSVSN